MKFKDFQELINRPYNEKYLDRDVVILRSDPGIRGPCASTPVKTAGPGIDWDHSKFIIFPENPLFQRERGDEITELRKKIDGLVWENFNLKKEAKKT